MSFAFVMLSYLAIYYLVREYIHRTRRVYPGAQAIPDYEIENYDTDEFSVWLTAFFWPLVGVAMACWYVYRTINCGGKAISSVIWDAVGLGNKG